MQTQILLEIQREKKMQNSIENRENFQNDNVKHYPAAYVLHLNLYFIKDSVKKRVLRTLHCRRILCMLLSTFSTIYRYIIGSLLLDKILSTGMGQSDGNEQVQYRYGMQQQMRMRSRHVATTLHTPINSIPLSVEWGQILQFNCIK